ncbi:hypothetical protein EDD18DRAFT_1077975, partial [Armillaria luteobubalina]
ETKAAWQGNQMQEFLKGCCKEIQMDFSAKDQGMVLWRGKHYSKLTPADHQEIVWEIAKLEFCLELAELDHMVHGAAPSHDTACKLAVSCCFVGTISIANIGSANMGFANPIWFDHMPYLCLLCHVMQTWMCSKPDIIAKDKLSWLWTEVEILELEKVMTVYYIDMFFLHFSRPPVLLQYLPHNSSTSCVPLPWI